MDNHEGLQAKKGMQPRTDLPLRIRDQHGAVYVLSNWDSPITNDRGEGPPAKKVRTDHEATSVTIWHSDTDFSQVACLMRMVIDKDSYIVTEGTNAPRNFDDVDPLLYPKIREQELYVAVVAAKCFYFLDSDHIMRCLDPYLRDQTVDGTPVLDLLNATSCTAPPATYIDLIKTCLAGDASSHHIDTIGEELGVFFAREHGPPIRQWNKDRAKRIDRQKENELGVYSKAELMRNIVSIDKRDCRDLVYAVWRAMRTRLGQDSSERHFFEAFKINPSFAFNDQFPSDPTVSMLILAAHVTLKHMKATKEDFLEAYGAELKVIDYAVYGNLYDQITRNAVAHFSVLRFDHSTLASVLTGKTEDWLDCSVQYRLRCF